MKSERNQGSTFSLENTVLEKPQRGQIDPQPFLGSTLLDDKLKTAN